MILAMIYIDRLFSTGLIPTERNLHKILLTSLQVANKFNEDSVYDSAYFAKVGGTHINTLAELEAEFLEKIGFQLVASTDHFEKYAEFALEEKLSE